MIEPFRGELYAIACIDYWHHDKSSRLVAFTPHQVTPLLRILNKSTALYPRPVQVVHKIGGNFKWYTFACLLCIDVSITRKNPQSNTMCKCMDQTIAIVFNTLFLFQPHQTPQQGFLPLLDDGLVSSAFDGIHNPSCTKGKSRCPCNFYNMLLNAPLIGMSNFTHNGKTAVNDALLTSNQWHINNDYYVWQQALKNDIMIKGKLADKTSAPFEIVNKTLVKLKEHL